MGLTRNRDSWIKPQRGQESKGLRCLTRDCEHELVTEEYGTGESRRGDWKIEM